MGTTRDLLIYEFRDGESPNGAEFKLLIDSIISRSDDGIDKFADTPLKISAGKELHAPIINLCPNDVLDPHWVLSLKVAGKDGLNIGQGSDPTSPVLYIDKATNNVGIGTTEPAELLSTQRNVNGRNGLLIANASDGDNAHVIARLKNDVGEGEIFLNSSQRPVDGGFNTMTVRNNAGDLRLLGPGDRAKITLKGDINGFVGVNTDSPTDTLSVNGNLSLQGKSIFLGLASAGIDALLKPGMFWMGSGKGADIFKHGIYKTDGPWTSPNFQQLRVQFDTGIQLGAGTGANTGYGKSYVEVVNGKGLMVSSGNVGVGTVNPIGRVHVVTPNADGDVSAWGNGQMVVGQDGQAGGLGLSYSATTNTGSVYALAPGTAWKNLALRANAILFCQGPNELMRLTPDGKLGLGTATPDYGIEARKDMDNGWYGTSITNRNAGVNAFVASLWKTDSNDLGVIFKNSSTRTVDGGAHTMTLRNDGGDLRLQALGSVGIQVKATSGNVGIGTANAAGKLHVVTAPSAGGGEFGGFDATCVAVGQEAAAGAGSGAVAFSYSPSTLTGGISAVSPGVDWRNLALRAKETILYGGGTNEVMRVTANGRVGVGTNIPDFLFEVRKDQSVGTWGMGLAVSNLSPTGDTFALIALRAGTTGPGYIWKNGPTRTAEGGANVMTMRNDSGDLRLQSVGGNGIFVKANNGNVGLGSSNPLGKLHVVTPASDSNISTFDQGQFVVGQDGNGGGVALSYAGGMGYISAISPGTAWRDLMLRANTLVLNSQTGETMRLTVDNKVGIGTTSPKAKLTVNGGNVVISASDNAGLQNALGYPSLGAISFYGHGRNVPNDSASITCGSTTWDEQGFLAFSTSNDGAASIERMRITEIGRVGIGDTAPRSALHVASTGKVLDGNGLMLGKIGDMIRPSTTQGEELGNIEIGFAGWRDSTPNQIGAKISAVRIATFGTPNTHLIQSTELSFSTGDGVGNGTTAFQETCAERMRIKRDGKVGIGTTNPISTLGVAGNVSIGAAAASGNAAPANGLLVQGDLITQARLVAHSRIQVSPWATGSVGTAELTTGGASPISNRLVFGTDNSGWKFGFSKRTGNEGPITDLMVLNDDGRLGLGTISPAGKLHVVTTPSDGLVGGWNDGQVVIGSAGNGGGLGLSYANDTSYLTSLAPGAAWKNLMLRAGVLLFNTNNGEVMRIANNGLVGIGNNNPQHLLDIQQGGRSANPVTGRPLYVSSSCGPDSNGVEFRHENGSQGIGFGYNTIYATGTYASQDLGLKSLGVGNLYFTTNNVQSMAINGSTNRVGIGTNVPAGKLHVVTASSNGDLGSWDSGQFVVGREGNLGAIGLSYDQGANSSCITSLSPSVAWRDLNFKANGYSFRYGGASEIMRLNNNGFTSIGGVSAESALSIGTPGGKEEWPNGSMHLSNDCILFGGNNAGREANSCQISAGKHIANTMCIVGMSDAAAANRRVDMWAEGGFALYGRMGIGTRDPQFPVHIPAAIYGAIPEYQYMNFWTCNHSGASAANVSLWAGGRIIAAEFNAISDRRIKKNIVPSLAADDLNRLQKIVVNNYEFRDQLVNNAMINKGFIAQEVKEIFPEAVSQHAEFVPDIMAAPKSFLLEPAAPEESEEGSISINISMPTKNLTIVMQDAHGLVTGDVIRIASKEGMEERKVKVVNKVTFKIEDWKHSTEGLFVYGKRVDDFLVVDYNRIYTLNVSATQELSRQVDVLKQENNGLRTELEALKADHAQMLASLLAIQNALNLNAASE